MPGLSQFCAFFCQTLLVKESFIVKNLVKKGQKVFFFWIPKRNDGSDANKNGIICINHIFVAILLLAQFTRF